MSRTARRTPTPLFLAVLALAGCAETPAEKVPGAKDGVLSTAGAGSKSGTSDVVRFANAFTASQVEDPTSKTVSNIAVGETQRGTLEASDPKMEDGSSYDLWHLELTSQQEVDIQISSTAFDTYLLLAAGKPGSGGSILLSDDDGGEGTNSRIQTSLRPGSYSILANSYGSGASGAYSLSVGGSGAVGGPRRISAGETVSGELGSASPTLGDGSPYELWQLEGRAGDQVTVTLSSSDFDSFLHLAYGPSFTSSETLATDDDGAGNLNSRITATLPETGIYWIVANAYNAGARGAYEVNVQASNLDWAQRFPGGGDPNGKYAVVVGIDDYPGTVNDLRGPTDDATLVRDVLVSRFGFPAQNVVFLQDGEGTREMIANAIVRHLGQAGPNGTAVFYYSGHGTQLPDNRGLTGRFDPETGNGTDEALAVHGGLILDEELGYLLQQIRAQNTLVIVDACFSGTSTRGADFLPKFVAADALDSFRLPKAFITNEIGSGLGFGGGIAGLEEALSNPDRHVLMAASSEDQVSWTVGTWPDRAGPASLYTYYWAKVMGNAPLTTTFQRVHAMVSDSVNAHVLRAPNLETQTAQISGPTAGAQIGAFLRSN